MTQWHITASWDLEGKSEEFAPRTNLKAKPMPWEEWYSRARSESLHVTELFHTDSGYYGAYDKTTRRRVGAWVDRDGGLGYFEQQSEDAGVK